MLFKKTSVWDLLVSRNSPAAVSHVVIRPYTDTAEIVQKLTLLRCTEYSLSYICT